MRIMPSYTYVPKSVSELNDLLGFMIVRSPLFEDIAFPGQPHDGVLSIDRGATDSSAKDRRERFQGLSKLAQRVRTRFEADPTDDNGETRAGRKLIYEMKAVLRSRS
jgi:hypothetical protein